MAVSDFPRLQDVQKYSKRVIKILFVPLRTFEDFRTISSIEIGKWECRSLDRPLVLREPTRATVAVCVYRLADWSPFAVSSCQCCLKMETGARPRLRICSRETGSAVPSRVSPLVLHTQAGSGAYSRDPLLPAFRDIDYDDDDDRL